MWDRQILDHQITASSVGMSLSLKRFNARDARLWLKSSSWVSALVDYSPWLQITFAPEIKLITGIATQGSPLYDWFITSYTLKYSMTGKIWKNYEQGGLIKVCNAFITDRVHSSRLPNLSAGLFRPSHFLSESPGNEVGLLQKFEPKLIPFTSQTIDSMDNYPSLLFC